jgi:glycosyltransferase involved in cell wall biosynthesis
MPTVSVIVPVYKAEKSLSRCVESILRQTYRDFELLLVDDGSPDGSPGICDAYAASDPRVKALHKPNGGAGSARNQGMATAIGEWFAFVDADDWIADDYLEVLLAGAERHGADAAFCNYNDAIGNTCSPRTFYRDERMLSAADILKGLLRRFEIPAAMWGKLFRATSVRSIRVDERLRIGEDLLFLLEVFHRGECRRTVILPDHPYFYDQTNASLMRCGAAKIAEDKRMLDAYRDFVARHPDLAEKNTTDHATFMVRTIWSLAREEGRPDPVLTRLLRGQFRRSLSHLYGHESRPVFLYLLHPSLGFGWYRAESAFRRWLHGRRAAKKGAATVQ